MTTAEELEAVERAKDAQRARILELQEQQALRLAHELRALDALSVKCERLRVTAARERRAHAHG